MLIFILLTGFVAVFVIIEFAVHIVSESTKEPLRKPMHGPSSHTPAGYAGGYFMGGSDGGGGGSASGGCDTGGGGGGSC